MSLRERLVQQWYDPAARPRLLRPLSWLYRAVTAVRVRGYRRGWLAHETLPVPVLVVGNITVGGTGKTPLVIALVAALRTRGWHPGVVSRGYGGQVDQPGLLPATAEPQRYGDEPCLIRQRTGVPVAVGRDRPAAARLLLEAGADVVVADDGLQHYRLGRDVEICVIDGSRGLGNGLPLPCGPLREPPSRLDEVDWRIGNGGDAGLPGVLPMRLGGGKAERIGAPTRQLPLEHFRGQAVHAVAGIGNPRRFFDSLCAAGLRVHEHAFPDHHAYVAADLAFADADAVVLMTEKDAVKCRAFAPANAWSVPIDAHLPAAFYDQVDARLRAVAASKKK